MAKKLIRIDDIDNKEIDVNFEIPPVEFSFLGKYYEIDLRQTNLEKFEKAMEPWIAAATETTPPVAARGRRDPARGPKPGATRPDTGSGRSKEELAAIREWLKKEGHEVNDRGRIKAELLQLFDDAHAPQNKSAAKTEEAKAS